MSVAAIIPAYNEARTIERVIRAIRDSKAVREVIVVSDGSTDATAAVARQAGACVLILKENCGKGEALRAALSRTDAPILFFCDADLLGLRPDHVRALILPVRTGDAGMSIGLRDRWGIPGFVARLDPMMAIGGERVLRREIFDRLTPEEYHGFCVEVSMNVICARYDFPIALVEFAGVTHVPKEVKWGLYGFFRRLPWLMQIVQVRVRNMFPRSKPRARFLKHYDDP